MVSGQSIYAKKSFGFMVTDPHLFTHPLRKILIVNNYFIIKNERV